MRPLGAVPYQRSLLAIDGAAARRLLVKYAGRRSVCGTPDAANISIELTVPARDLVGRPDVLVNHRQAHELLQARAGGGVDQALLERDLLRAGPERQKRGVNAIEGAIEHRRIVERARDDLERPSGVVGVGKDGEKFVAAADEGAHGDPLLAQAPREVPANAAGRADDKDLHDVFLVAWVT